MRLLDKIANSKTVDAISTNLHYYIVFNIGFYIFGFYMYAQCFYALPIASGRFNELLLKIYLGPWFYPCAFIALFVTASCVRNRKFNIVLYTLFALFPWVLLIVYLIKNFVLHI